MYMKYTQLSLERVERAIGLKPDYVEAIVPACHAARIEPMTALRSE